ncbi:MAG: electron transport complex subunit RsxC [Clostridia bacterium]|nr:electron transport complex subunit RsxC [Clostridia bacterium]
MKAVKGKLLLGGVHVPDKKSLANAAPIEVLPPPQKVAINLSQSLGRPSEPCVAAGDTVKEGQVIATAAGPISSQVFASISGTVKEIKPLVTEGGVESRFIVIEGDGSGEKQYLEPLENPSADDIKKRIFDAGIVGLGGAGFPTAVKVAPKTPVDTLILNGAECEPYLTCDHRLMLEHTDEIARGARYIAKSLNVTKILIGIEVNKPECIAKFEAYDDIGVVALKKRYPMGGEKQLIYSCTGRKVGIGKLPADSGVVVQNVATCFAVCEAVELGKPLYERVLTVSGGAVKEPKNLKVRVGTSIEEIIAYCGGESSAPKKAILGGPMTGIAIKSYDLYTKKTTSGVLLMTESEAAAEEPTPCLNCGMCADHCPMHLMPMNTAFYANAGDFELAAKLGNTMSCIECGVCEYVCPAKRPLIQAIRKTKAAMRNKK